MDDRKENENYWQRSERRVRERRMVEVERPVQLDLFDVLSASERRWLRRVSRLRGQGGEA
jgi:hypothetical protein